MRLSLAHEGVRVSKNSHLSRVATVFSDIPTSHVLEYTLWLFNIAMENGPSIDDFPIKTCIYKGLSMAMLVITRWYLQNGWPVSGKSVSPETKTPRRHMAGGFLSHKAQIIQVMNDHELGRLGYPPSHWETSILGGLSGTNPQAIGGEVGMSWAGSTGWWIKNTP